MPDKANNEINIGELPRLRIIELQSLAFHEEPDEERMLRLVERFGSEGVLKHPPVVATASGEDDKFILLDGANRVTALTKLGFAHLPVQVVKLNDPLLSLSSWNHAVEKYDKNIFLDRLSKQKSLRIEEAPGDDSGAFICSLTFKDGDSLYLSNSEGLADQMRELLFITDLYVKSSAFDRVSYSDLEHLARNYPDFKTLIAFKDFTGEDIRRMTELGLRLPSGITRVILPKRALGLNIRLEFLRSSLSLEEKNHWLAEMIQKKVREKSIRFYQEQTFVFNE